MEKSTEQQRLDYETPHTERTRMQLEQGLCVVASTEKATIQADEKSQTVEVEEYKEVSNEIEFD